MKIQDTVQINDTVCPVFGIRPWSSAADYPDSAFIPAGMAHRMLSEAITITGSFVTKLKEL